jgi:hypothetical protein
MQDAIIQGMHDYVYKERDADERLWQVVIIERDEMGSRKKDNPNEILYKASLTYSEAMSEANAFNQESYKRGS